MSLFGNTVGFAAGNIAKKKADGPMDMNGFPVNGLPEPEAKDQAANAGFVTDRITKRMIYRQGGKNRFNVLTVAPVNVSSGTATIFQPLPPGDTDSYPVDYQVTVATKEAAANIGTKADSFTLRAGVPYTMSVNVVEILSGTPSFGFRFASDCTYEGDSKTAGQILKRESPKAAGKHTLTFTPTEDVTVYPSLFCTGTTAEEGNITFCEVMVEVGAEATEYEPYYNSIEQLTMLMDSLLGVNE